ncbi:MAG: vWA domain-containing protein [Hyphomicrobiaceae bacterium]
MVDEQDEFALKWNDRCHVPARQCPSFASRQAIIAAFLGLTGLGTLPFSATAENAPALAIVVDGSGSMWGRLQGSSEPKFVDMGEILLKGLTQHATGAVIGVVSFGERGRGGCSAAQVRLPPARFDVGRYTDAMRGFSPQGKGPIVLGMRRAAQALFRAPLPPETPRHMIVVHDDPDNCFADPCAAAKQLKDRYRNLKISVISLAPKSNDRGALRCVSELTGGQFSEASDADALSGALLGTIKVALNRRDPRTAPPLARREVPPQAQGPKPAQRAKRAQSSGLTLSASMTSAGQPLQQGLIWTIRPTERENGSTIRTTNPRPSLALQPGRYIVTLESSAFRKTREVDVEAGPRADLAFDLGVGALDLSAELAVGGATVDEAVFRIRSLDRPVPDEFRSWSGLRRSSPLLLPPGRYRVTVSAGHVRRSQEIAIREGEERDLRLVMDAGYLIVKVPARPGVPKLTQIAVSRTNPSTPDSRQQIVASVRQDPSFLLPAGTYSVVVQRGHLVNEQSVVVIAGKAVEQTISSPRMDLKIYSKLRGREGHLKTGVAYRIWHVSTPGQPVIMLNDAAPTVALSPGAYRIESRIGDHNAVVLREFEVSSAPSGELMLEHDAGRVRLSSEEGSVDGDVSWVVRDRTGRTLWRTFKPSAELTLKASRYEILAELPDRSVLNAITLESGQVLDIKLSEEAE